jgi:hypothetical protein
MKPTPDLIAISPIKVKRDQIGVAGLRIPCASCCLWWTPAETTDRTKNHIGEELMKITQVVLQFVFAYQALAILAGSLIGVLLNKFAKPAFQPLLIKAGDKEIVDSNQDDHDDRFPLDLAA